MADDLRVASIQVGRIGTIGPYKMRSAIIKLPVEGAVRVGALGLEGDEQADQKVHGGPDKAVYFYPMEHYPSWLADTPRHAELLKPGGFGENITSTGLDESSACIGDVFAIGSVLLQVTQPRQPCIKLATRFDDPGIGKLMMQTSRSGWYARVLKDGHVQAGDTIELRRRPNPTWTITRFSQTAVRKTATLQEWNELSQLEGLAETWREKICDRLRAGQYG